MDFVIEMQGLRDKENHFLPKEVAVVSLQGNVAAHWTIAPPMHVYTELPRDLREGNDFVSSRILGLQWFDGDISQRKLQHHFYNIARVASKIYIKGGEKARYVQSLMSRHVHNIDEYNVVAFSELERLHDIPQSCLFHALQQDEYISRQCALHRAQLLRTWLRSLVPAGSIAKFSDALFDALRFQLYNGKWRTNSVRFASDDSTESRDVVDGKILLTKKNNNIYESDEDDDDEGTLELNDNNANHEHERNSEISAGPKSKNGGGVCGR